MPGYAGFISCIFGKRRAIRAVGKIFRRSAITDSVVDILLKSRYLGLIPRRWSFDRQQYFRQRSCENKKTDRRNRQFLGLGHRSSDQEGESYGKWNGISPRKLNKVQLRSQRPERTAQRPHHEKGHGSKRNQERVL